MEISSGSYRSSEDLCVAQLKCGRVSVIGGVFPSCVNCCGNPGILHFLFSLQIGLLEIEINNTCAMHSIFF